MHTRRAADPAGALAALREPLAGLAADTGLVVEPGRLVIELRPPGMDKGAALTALVAERKAGPVLFAGDDLGDLAAFGAVRALREDGHPGLTVCSASGEVSELAAEADLVVDGPGGVAALLGSLARSLARTAASSALIWSANHCCGGCSAPRFGQERRPALTFGIRHAQRLVQRLRRLGDVERVHQQRVGTELGAPRRPPGTAPARSPFREHRAFLGHQVHAVPDRVDQQHVGQPVGRERARIVVVDLQDHRIPVVGAELVGDLAGRSAARWRCTRGTRAGHAGTDRRTPGG